jgi:hypothetical protein
VHKIKRLAEVDRLLDLIAGLPLGYPSTADARTRGARKNLPTERRERSAVWLQVADATMSRSLGTRLCDRRHWLQKCVSFLLLF